MDDAAAPELVEAATRRLAAAGVADPAADARAIVAAADGDPERAGELLDRRAAREPLAYVLGACAFRGLRLAVDARVHVPRDDRTGLLVDVALELPEHARVHEVGTGAGAVALAIRAARPDLRVTASDVSAAAIEVARANARRLGLDVPLSVADGLPAGRFDLVVANLPYSALAELDGVLPPESAAFQPHVAVVAGPDALDAIRRFVASLPSGQRVALEHAPEQASAVRALLDDARTRRDAAGDERMTAGVAR